MTTQGVNRLGSLLDKKVPCLQEHHPGLAVNRLDRYEAHSWPRYGLTDRLCIDRVGLATFDIRLHVSRRDQSHVVAECRDLPRPKVRSAASFKAHAAARKSIKKPNDF